MSSTSIKIPLEPNEQISYVRYRRQFLNRIPNGVIFQFNLLWQLVRVQVTNTTLYIVVQDKAL